GTHLTSANNVFYGFAGQQFINVESGSTMSSDHDLFFSTGGHTALPSGPGLTLTSPVVGDPMLANPANGDFRLQPGSPAVDGGTSSVSSTVTEDFNGIPRPQGGAYDIGGYEYVPGGTAPPAVVSVRISPASFTLGQSQSQQFSATVSGSSNTAVTWTMNPSIGTLTAAGLYAAPASITAQQSVQITARSAADATKSATATVTLTPPPPA